MPNLAALLEPPKTCQASGLPFDDKRKGSIWFCPHARKILGKSKEQPPCKCSEVLRATTIKEGPQS